MAKPVTVFSRLLLAAALAGTVAGCFQTGDPGPAVALDNTGQRQAIQAARGTRAPTIPDPTSTPEYMTLDKAKSDCWMQAETDKKVPKQLDARGKWVEKCAAGKMREQATQWASPTAAPSYAPASAPPAIADRMTNGM
jgi:hypothetical protein